MLGTTSALDFKIVDSLPTANINATTIYLVPYGNEYEEYIYINNKWEMLGSTKVDLSDYVRKDEIIITNENGTTKAVGGISAGTILTGKNVLQVLEDILYPYVAFSISVDSISPSTSVYEKGTTATITGVKVKITNGSRSITNLKLYDSSSKTNLLGEKTSGISTSNTFTISRAVTSSTSFYAEATDGVKTIGDSTSFLSFYYPTFYGVLDTGYSLTSSLITSKTKVLKANKNNTFTYTATNQHPFVAFPASYGNLTSIKDSSNLEYIGDFVKTTMNLNVTGGTVSYNIYVLKDPTDISNYKFIFSQEELNMPKIATNFEVGSAQPIDTRFVVQSESDLANLKVYEGLEVYIKDLKAKRLYNGTEWVDFIQETIDASVSTAFEADY